MEVTPLAAEFVDYVLNTRARATALAYGKGLDRFRCYLEERGTTIRTADRAVLVDFVVWLRKRGLAAATVRLWATAAKRYAEYLEGRIDDLPKFIRPDMPRTNKNIPEVIEDDALRVFFQIAEEVPEPYRTALMLLPLSGLRISEACGLRLSNVIANYRGTGAVAFKIVGKGDKEREVPLFEEAKPILREYLMGWRREQKSVYLFPSERKKEDAPIAARTLRSWMEKIRGRVGVDNLTPHTMRRTFCSILDRNGMSGSQIARLAGHASLQTTHESYIAPHMGEITSRMSQIRVKKGES